MFPQKANTRKLDFTLPPIKCTKEWLDKSKASHKLILERRTNA